MAASVYKTSEGRSLVERYYQDILDAASGSGFEEVFIESSVGRTHVLRFGGGKPPLVMLHGSMSNSASWLGAAPDFLDAFTVFCVDLSGEPGLSEPVRLPLASEEPARWLASVLDALGIEKCAFLGMSLGSWYGLHFAVRHPQRVTSLSMITASGLAPQRTSFLFKALLFMMLGRFGQKRLNALVYHKARVPAEVLDYQALVSAHFNPLVEPIPIFSDAELARLTFPIQYFGGDRDALLDTEKSAERLRALTEHSEIHILRDTGHVILDQFGVVKAFLVRSL
jgi:pimeloyl-ACP methyl ester carboxylesterase